MVVMLQYFAAISASLGSLATGTALGWTSNLEPKIKAGDYGFSVSETEWALLTSILNIGAAIICIVVGYIVNIVGRRGTLLVILAPLLIGWTLMIFAVNPAMLIVGRAFLGISSGSLCVVGPVYVGEIAEKSIRGALGALTQLMITLGILLVYVLGSVASPKSASIVCGIIPIIFGICIFFCPESPTYFIMKGNEAGAVDALKRFRGSDFDSSSEIADLQKEEEERQSQNVREAIKKKSSKKAMMISFGLMFFQQMCGINAVIFYTTAIFKDANIELAPEYATIIVGVVQVIATLVATATLDKLGRRLLLIVSDSLMALCTLSLGIYYGIKSSNPDAVGGIGWLSLISLCVFIVAFSLGFGPVPWLMMGELFSSDIKGLAGSLSGTLNWGLAFLVTVAYPPLRESLGPSACFIIFTVLSVIGTFFCWKFVPETKGKSLKEIQVMLGED